MDMGSLEGGRSCLFFACCRRTRELAIREFISYLKTTPTSSNTSALLHYKAPAWCVAS